MAPSSGLKKVTETVATRPPAEVGTLQVAPTILRALGLDPAQLDGVRLEGTRELPAVQFGAAR